MARLRMNSRGLVVTDLAPIAVTLVMVGMFLGIGSWINKDLGETTFATEQVTNESIAFTNLTWAWTQWRVQSITGSSNGTHALGIGNLTTREIGTVSQINSTFICPVGACIAGTWNVSYLAYKSAGYLVVANSTSGIASLASWLPLLAVVIGSGFVIAFLVKGLGGGGAI